MWIKHEITEAYGNYGETYELKPRTQYPSKAKLIKAEIAKFNDVPLETIEEFPRDMDRNPTKHPYNGKYMVENKDFDPTETVSIQHYESNQIYILEGKILGLETQRNHRHKNKKLDQCKAEIEMYKNSENKQNILIHNLKESVNLHVKYSQKLRCENTINEVTHGVKNIVHWGVLDTSKHSSYSGLSHSLDNFNYFLDAVTMNN